MSLYPLVILVVVLGLFVAISLIPVVFTDKDMESLVILPQ